jgi:hypothetical protein
MSNGGIYLRHEPLSNAPLFSCGDEMGFTLLGIVKLQARSNHIDVAISTASRIVDETDWIDAMETIASGNSMVATGPARCIPSH